MKKKMCDIIKKCKELVCNMKFSFMIAWDAAPFLTIVRIAFMLFLAVIPTVEILVSKNLVDIMTQSLSSQDKTQYVKRFIFGCIFLLTIWIISRMVRIWEEIFITRHKDLVNKSIDKIVMNKAAALDISYYDSSKFYNQLNIAKRDASCLPDLIWYSTSVIKYLINVVICFVALWQLSIFLPIIVVIICVPDFFMKKIFNLYFYRYGVTTSNDEMRCAYIFKMFVEPKFAKEIKLYESKEYLIGKYSLIWKKVYEGRKKLTKKNIIKSGITASFPIISKIGVQFLAAVRVLKKESSLGGYVFYVGMVSNAISSTMGLLDALAGMVDRNLRIKNYQEFMCLKSKISEEGDERVDCFKSLEFQDVSFRYPDTERYILKNVSFKMTSKEKVAFVGLNGSGKTTLTKLIMRFYEPTEGKILLNEQDIHKFKIDDVRLLFSAVFQDYAKYAFKVKDAIGIAKVDEIDNIEKIRMACKKSGADEFIEKWENTYDTYLTKNFDIQGEVVSGGQWQKIAIASAFFRNAKVLILDEPTASLDPIAEYNVFNTISDLSKNRNNILVSHRLSSVVMADKILMIKEGEIIEQGTHKDLLKKMGEYAELFLMQSKRYIENL